MVDKGEHNPFFVVWNTDSLTHTSLLTLMTQMSTDENRKSLKICIIRVIPTLSNLPTASGSTELPPDCKSLLLSLLSSLAAPFAYFSYGEIGGVVELKYVSLEGANFAGQSQDVFSMLGRDADATISVGED